MVALGWFVVSSALQGDPIWNDLGEMRERLQDMPWWVFLVAGGVVSRGLGTGLRSWWTTRFVIDDQEFRPENTGAFQESSGSRSAASSPSTSPSPSRPALGLAQVKIDVGADDGATLSFKRSRATEIRDYLMTRATGRTATTSEPGREASAWTTPRRATKAGAPEPRRDHPERVRDHGHLVPDARLRRSVGAGVAVRLVRPRLGGMAGLALAILGSLSKRLFGQFTTRSRARQPACASRVACSPCAPRRSPCTACRPSRPGNRCCGAGSVGPASTSRCRVWAARTPSR